MGRGREGKKERMKIREMKKGRFGQEKREMLALWVFMKMCLGLDVIVAALILFYKL